MSYVLGHKIRVMQLYRHALKTCLDWTGSRAQWYDRVSDIEFLILAATSRTMCEHDLLDVQ